MAVLRISDLDFSYPDGHTGLSGIDLRVEAGEHVGLVGASGAGKSTLLHVIASVAQGKRRGHVEAFGLDTSKKRHIKKLRSSVGIVFQETEDQLFMPTVGEDVAFGPRAHGVKGDELAEKVENALGRVGLAGFETRNPRRLSGGEKRRAALATVLAMDAKLLALDEPTANLDPRASRNIAELLAGLGETILLATHDLDLVKTVCESCVLLNSGKKVAEGKTEELLADEKLLADNGLI